MEKRILDIVVILGLVGCVVFVATFLDSQEKVDKELEMYRQQVNALYFVFHVIALNGYEVQSVSPNLSLEAPDEDVGYVKVKGYKKTQYGGDVEILYKIFSDGMVEATYLYENGEKRVQGDYRGDYCYRNSPDFTKK